MPDLVECAKYAHCPWRNSVGSCPESCCQFKHKNELQVVFCKECKFHDDCDQMMIVRRRDPVLELNLLEYHRIEYCSAGELKEERL